MEPRAIQKAKRRDRIARWVISAGGMLIIFTVIGIFFLIVEVTIPLFLPPQAALRSRFPAPPLPAGTRALAVGKGGALLQAREAGSYTSCSANVRRGLNASPPVTWMRPATGWLRWRRAGVGT